jgi:hypothetical protein
MLQYDFICLSALTRMLAAHVIHHRTVACDKAGHGHSLLTVFPPLSRDLALSSSLLGLAARCLEPFGSSRTSSCCTACSQMISRLHLGLYRQLQPQLNPQLHPQLAWQQSRRSSLSCGMAKMQQGLPLAPAQQQQPRPPPQRQPHLQHTQWTCLSTPCSQLQTTSCRTPAITYSPWQ